MASSSSSNSNELIVGGSSPTTTDANDNDRFLVTSDGTENGEVLEEWSFDGETQTWIQLPLGSSCPSPMTRGALLSLRNSSSLEKDCHYVITDYDRGTVGSTTILLHAVEPDSLSMNVHVQTTHDNVAWTGTYNIDTNRMESLHDNIGNDVFGTTSVDTFPWGNTNVEENEVREGRLNYTAGTFRENYIGSATTVNLISGNMTGNRMEQSAVITVNGNATFNQNVVNNDSTVSVTSGSNYHNTFDSSVAYTQVGTGYTRYCKYGSNSTVTIGNTNMSNVSLFYTNAFNTSGSTGTISNSVFDGTYTSLLKNIPNLVISESTFGGRTHILADNAARLRLYRCSGDSAGRYLVSANATLVANYSRVSNYGYIQVTNGTLNADYCSSSELGYISHQSTGVNSVNRSSATTQGNIRFLNDVTGGRIYYSKASSGASIYQSGFSENCYQYYCEASSLSQMYIQNAIDARHYYNDADSLSYIRTYGNNTGQSIIYYSSARARGFIEHNSITSRQRFYGLSAEGQSIIRQTGGAVNANTYYSTAHAYYYMLLTNSGTTRYGLHGYGRQTFNGQPATNGTGTRNWT